MSKNLELYVNKIFEKAKVFLQKNFPKEYEKPDVKISAAYEPNTKFSWFYKANYNYETNKIIFITHENEGKKPKDEDVVESSFKVKMKRKNAYLVSMIHEMREAQYFNLIRAKKFPLSEYDVMTAHEAAVDLELRALDKLVKQTKGEDKEEFSKRKEARVKELEHRAKFIKKRGV